VEIPPAARPALAPTAPDIRLHPHEAERLASLRSYQIYGAAADDTFDALTRLAARTCYTPISLITLVEQDTQWFLSHHGFSDTGGDRAGSLCGDVVASGKPLVVADLTRVARYASIPLVTGPEGLRSYAGVPLVGRDGLPIGTLCVLDIAPRDFTEDQLRSLHDLAEQVVTALELRRFDLSSGRLTSTG
jgi:GAF domain-containing protein